MHYTVDREQLRHVRKPLNLPPVATEAIVLILVVAVMAIGVLVGLLVGHESAGDGGTRTVTVSTR